MNISFKDAATSFPRYLSDEKQKELYDELKNFDGIRYYASIDDPEPLQGDGWSRTPLMDIVGGERLSVRAAVISNSCDLTAEAERKTPAWITIAPIVSFADFEQLLGDGGFQAQAVGDVVAAIRRQELSEYFFVPACDGLGEDCLVLFSQMQSYPYSLFNDADEKSRLFTLSQAGFWLFLVKLSVHFCRLGERIDRTLPAKAA